MKKKTGKKIDLLDPRDLEGIADASDVKAWNDFVSGKTKSPKGFTSITFQPPTAAQIKEFRRQMALTQASLARAMNTSARAVQQWEQGQRKLAGPAAMLMRMFQANPADYIKKANAMRAK